MFYFITFSLKNCDKGYNWEGEPNGSLFKIEGNPLFVKIWELKSFQLGEKRKIHDILVTTYNLD